MNRPRAILLGALAVALLTPSVSESQTPAAERAVRAVVDSFFHLIDREKWDSAAALVDAARFEPFLRQQISQARGDRSDMFAGVHTQHELFALTPAQALSRWIEAKDERTQRRRSMLMQNCPPQALEAIMSFPAPKHVVLAVAIQDDTSAFAIHSTAGAGSFRIPEMLIGGEMIMSLHKQAAVWKIDPRGDLMRPLNSGGVWYGCPEIKKKD